MNAPAMTAPDLRSTLFAAEDWYLELLAQVREDQLSGPTPCAEYDVRQLISHMSVVLEKVAGFGTHHLDVLADHHLPQPERDVIAERRAEQEVDGLTPQQWVQRGRDHVQAARASWTDEVLDTPIQLGWGPVLPGRVVSGIFVMEVLAHAWDLATATGQASEAPGDLGATGLAAATAILPQTPRGVEVGVPFNPPVTPAADAGPTEQLVNWTGRSSR